MARKRDLFDDTTMTFGEHLEVLRVHVWKSLVGIAIGIVLSMFMGDRIIGILKAPIDRALRNANIENVEDDLKEVSLIDYFKSLLTDEDTVPSQEAAPVEPVIVPPADTITVQVEVSDLFHALKEVAPDLLAEPSQDNGQPSDTGEATPEETTSVQLPLRSPDFALLKKAADRFNTPVTFRVEEAFMTYLKVTVVAGIMLASPWVFYQIWQFVAAGLYQHERKYVHIYLPMSIGLFASGAVFCFYFVFPLVLSFLIGFSQWLGVELQPRLSEYISLVLMMPMMFGISFQLPLIMLFLERIGVCTVETYTENWRMAVLVMSITSMLLTPSDPGSMLLMLAPLIVLYVGGIQLCRKRPRAEADPLA
jgi:sec-independent protein translocase protein TatC